ncbi:PREDICTED: prokineticin receptor 2-like [Branchiostoma belcheri]|uniref:Prokineticin receptor 2-like n=1 Tax=Branchiostoma belcheri TaxID=7741 RepID=A0A6P4ZD01_BRABE|nr:PREDICTED: prokineticin receptor 2-like [Branchiostoma belcheri]
MAHYAVYDDDDQNYTTDFTKLPYYNFSGFSPSAFQIPTVEDLLAKVYISRVLLGLVYAAILLVCTVGNTLLVAVVCRFEGTRTRANRLLVNLVISDLMTALLCVPFNIDYYVVRSEDWVFGTEMCGAVNYIKTVSLYVSTNTLVAMAIDRCLAVTSSLRSRKPTKRLYIPILLIWLASLLLAIPDLIFSDTVQFHFGDIGDVYDELTYCRRMWSIDQKVAYRAKSLLIFVVQFAVPAIIMVVCSLLVVRTVWWRKIPGIQCGWQIKAVERSRRKSFLLVILVFSFIICLGPSHVYDLVRDYGNVLQKEVANTMMFYVFEAVAMSNCVINTIAYVAVDNRMRKYIKRLFLTKLCRPRTPNPSRTHTRSISSFSYRGRTLSFQERRQFVRTIEGSSTTNLALDYYIMIKLSRQLGDQYIQRRLQNGSNVRIVVQKETAL